MSTAKILSVVALVVALDQGSKWGAREFGTAQLNKGGILGLLPGPLWLLLGAVVIGWFGWRILRPDHARREQLWLSLAVAAGASNLLDRVWFGGVWDFICYPWIEVCGNVADIVLVGASLGLVFYVTRDENIRTRKEQNGADSV